MPQAKEPCARRPGHTTEHRTRYALDNQYRMHLGRERWETPVTKHDAHRPDRIVDVITEFDREFGHPPSVRDIVDRVGLASTSAVHYHLRRLVDGGVIVACRCGCGRYRVAA